jgi:hypothetical protein
MKLHRKRLWLAAVAAAAAVLAPLLLPRSGETNSLPTGPQKAAISGADLAALRRAAGAANRARVSLAASGALPACTPPPLPPPTYPVVQNGHSNGQPYGIPFEAALTNGQLLTGYDEWMANHSVYRAGARTYHLYPWLSKLYDITGWVVGELQLPNLTARISPGGIVLCDQGGEQCLSATPPPASASTSPSSARLEAGRPPRPPTPSRVSRSATSR